MNEYINMLKAVANEAHTLAIRLGEEKNAVLPSKLSAQDLHNLRTILVDLNRSRKDASLSAHA